MIKRKKQTQEEDQEWDTVLKEAEEMAKEYIRANKHIDPWLGTYSFKKRPRGYSL